MHYCQVLNSSTARSRKRALCVVFVLALVVPACRRVDPPANVDANLDADASVPAGFVALDLKNEPVDEVLQKLAMAAGKPFVIDPDAQVVARCARISLLTGGNMPTAKALDLVRETLESHGFTMTESATGGIVVRRNADKPLPASCQGSSVPIAPSAESSASAELSDKFSAGVHQISETEVEVSRASLDMLLENSTGLARAARVIPQNRDGKTVGMKLFGIRAKSPFAVLGFKNGDTVMAIDGQAMTTPDEALKVYAGLKNAKKVEVAIERGGQTLKIVYRLLDK